MTAVPPIRREVLVDADPATAFEVFTAGIGRWWPLAEFSVHGRQATVSFAGDQIVEVSGAGETSVWGTVTRWETPTSVAFTWHPGGGPERASHVEVSFTAAGEQTLVTLLHTGWEVFEDPAAAREEYDHGWPIVLERYRVATADGDAEAAGRAEPVEPAEVAGPVEPVEPEDAQTWVALLHRPGPAAPADGSLFEDPRFGEHFAFLNRMRAAGYLVAAGPFDDELGSGMTVLRLPGADQLAEAERLATQDDASVASQFLSVTVRPWQVVLHA